MATPKPRQQVDGEKPGAAEEAFRKAAGLYRE